MNEDDAPLPELLDAVLDAATLDQLFFDLGAEAQVEQILLKGAAAAHANGAALSLAEARAVLIEGRALAVQIRYVHRSIPWTDTLMCVPGGIRLVRMRQHVEAR